MSAWPDAPELRAFLARATRRLVWIAAAEGAAAGLALALALPLVITLADWRGSIDRTVVAGLCLAALGVVVRILVSSRAQAHVAQLVERRAPECRNLIVTAAELIDRPARVRPYVGTLVCREAVRLVNRLDAAALFPARRALVALGASTALFALAVTLVAARPLASRESSKAAIDSAVILGVDVVITPPAYAARNEQAARDPARIEALAGSRIRVVVTANAAAVAMETLAGRQPLNSGAQQSFSAELRADADGYIALEPAASDGRPGVRRLIGLSVTADQAPRVRVTAPGRDLFLPAAERAIDIAIEADDDLGLASLRLRYTKVSGSGERFTFTDGEVPLQITRVDDRKWRGRGTLRPAALGLRAGDMVVYRGVAADRRPGAVPSESDSYIVEITAPGAVAAEGFAIEDDEDKYGISQQMVILKTERLIARARSVSADSLALEARTIAAEQRAVRAEFVFMMGGELAEEILAEASMDDLDEAAHAEADDEAIAGRLANRGRLDLLRAIRSMSRANTALNAADLARALVEEKAALNSLERAFSRTRYILRALTQRERLDLSRRLTGALTTVLPDLRPGPEAVGDARVSALRRALSGIAELAGTATLDATAAARAAILAESVLRVDPSAEPLQQVAARLTEAAGALQRGRNAEARGLLDRATTELTVTLRADLLSAPRRAPPLEVGRLEGALTDALRRSGSSR